ncbi:tRNA1(Val) (adenine(37)-N6)-methyltransferase [Aestuariibius sp. 2305UL40-4]|uniref:tRNA1(Val) (adenine(37)-N6)-methyltransferase n=1 Tax=Aestuariibius violaceus TaxID=3234132 RepID=UPI00345E2D01
MTGFDPADLTRNAFLGGRLTLLQPRGGYRAGIDPVLLAAACPARTGQSVLDLGCGGGVAGLCLAVRVPGIALTGVELQPDYADLARKNAALNGIAAEVVTADIQTLPADLRQRNFDHVIANPPYFREGRRSPSPDTGRETGLAETAPLKAWVDAAARRLAPKGTLTIIQRAERLPELIAASLERLGSLQFLPIAGRVGRDAHLVLVHARKGGRAAPRLAAPLVLHEGDRHVTDGDDYTQRISQVLRNGAPLNLWS